MTATVTLLPEKETPPVLWVMLSAPDTVLPAQPVPPKRTAPVVVVMLTAPLMVVPQRLTDAA